MNKRRLRKEQLGGSQESRGGKRGSIPLESPSIQKVFPRGERCQGEENQVGSKGGGWKKGVECGPADTKGNEVTVWRTFEGTRRGGTLGREDPESERSLQVRFLRRRGKRGGRKRLTR